MIEKKQTSTTTPATATPTRTPAAATPTATPTAKPSTATPKMERDSVKTTTPRNENPLAEGPGRTGADVVSGTSSTAEVLKDSRAIGQVAQNAGSRVSWLAKLGGGVAKFAGKIADWGDNVAAAAPKLAKGFLGLAKAAPIIGVGVAALDIGKAVLEKDPEKKQVAKGQAVLSVIGGAAGVIGLAAIATPLAPVLLGIGIGAAVLSVADTFLFKGKVSKAIASGLDAAVDGAKAVGSAVADVGKKAWNALTSL